MSTPQNNFLAVEVLQEDVKQPSLTLNENNILLEIDGVEALKQSIRRILQTERYGNSIYDHAYGVELEELIGEEMGFARIDVERRIKEALMEDDRIRDVTDFETEVVASTLHVTFTVDSIFGEIKQEVQLEN
ncbi:DUF2634 domain-containing protein [Aerococcaceae bacterium NML191219]|nr:DUF2634 domain-containing protein [Aerococcaceae bacterium NML191219]